MAQGLKKNRSRFLCNHCGAEYSKWQGQCTACGQWNTLEEQVAISSQHYAGSSQEHALDLSTISQQESVQRLSTHSQELDRVLGGGLVPGSVILIGGDPGIGKSTLLLQTLCKSSQQHPVLYVSGEESLQQIALSAQRLQLDLKQVMALNTVDADHVHQEVLRLKPAMVVIDSIQTFTTASAQAQAGSVTQIKEVARSMTILAKTTETIVILVGHVTKDGQLAGPRVLEHIVDTVLYFENQTANQRYRILRSQKNRFGPVNEVGIFAMTDRGLVDLADPTSLLLSSQRLSGSAVSVIWEGSRPFIIEIQALVDKSQPNHTRRVCVGIDQQRLGMLLAIINRYTRFKTYDLDIFMNVVGGLKISETCTDLALIAALFSAIEGKPWPHDLILLGEVGLSGELRPVLNSSERLQEAKRYGFKQAIIPKSNKGLKKTAMTLHAMDRIDALYDFFKNLTERPNKLT